MKKSSSSKKTLPKFIVADSERSADLLFATGFFAPDAFLFLDKAGKKSIVLNDLEYDRGRRSATVDEILLWGDLAATWKKRHRVEQAPKMEELAVAWLKSQKIREVEVPFDFPIGVATALMAAGVILKPSGAFLYPEREFKSRVEVNAIKAALLITQKGIARGIEVLRETEIDKQRFLRWRGKRLSSEILRGEIDAAIVRLGGLPQNTIVAGGHQACDPHERGHGPLKAHELIILDVFPRAAKTGYYGDLTRTVVRGRAGDAARHMWETVLEGQQKILSSIRPGLAGAPLHEAITQDFTKAGYPTEIRNGRRVGFFHGTGHGLGLELHESPRFSATTFQVGQVFTVEPGLYFPGIGGVRHEDVVVVTEKSAQLLSNFPKELEL